MAKKKIDNLTPESSASEMEEAIKELEGGKTNLVANEVTESKQEQQEVTPKEEVAEKAEIEPAPKEVVEDEFGGDYNKLKKSYKEAYAWNTRMAQDVAELKRNLEEVKASATKPKQPEQPQLTQEQFMEWYERDPISANRWLARLEAEQSVKTLQSELNSVKQELGGFLAQSTVNKFRSQFNDFAELEEEVKNEIIRMPREVTENPQNYERVLELGYWTAKGKKIKEAEERARAEGRKEAQVKTQAKKASFVEGSGSSAASEPPMDLDKMSSKDLFDLLKSRGAVLN